MTAEPYITFQGAKNLSVESALEKMEKFMNKFSTDTASAILSKDRRMSRPSDDSIEKLKTMISSLKEQTEFHEAEVKKLQVYNKKKRQLSTQEVASKNNTAISIATNAKNKKKHKSWDVVYLFCIV